MFWEKRYSFSVSVDKSRNLVDGFIVVWAELSLRWDI